MEKRRRLSLVLALCLLCGLLTGCAKKPEAPAAPEETASEEAAVQEATPEPELEPEAPHLYEPEKGHWGSYADIYEAYFIDEPNGMALARSAFPTAQMLDLDQNGVPEFALYYGVTTAGETLDVFTIEDGTVKRLNDVLSWEYFRNKEDRRDIPPIDAPASWDIILTDSTYMYLDTRILPFDWDYGAFSPRLDAKTGETFWMLSARQYDDDGVAVDDGLTYNETGAYWCFEDADGKMQAVRLRAFGMDWDDSQPYLGYAIFPDSEPMEVTADQSCAVTINGERSKEITENFVAEREAAYPPLSTAPEASRRVDLYALCNLEGELLARRFFRSFHASPTEDDLMVTAKTALCKVFTSNDRSRYNAYLTALETGGAEEAIKKYYEDFSDVLTQDCMDSWMAARTPLKYDKLLNESDCSTDVTDISLEEYQRYDDAVTYSFTVTIRHYNFSANMESEKTVTGQIQVGTEENLVRKLSIDDGQSWLDAEICALPQAVVE